MEENKNEQEKVSLGDSSTELESAAARRLRLLGIKNDDKIHDAEAEIKKGNFFANLWYKRKWVIIISAFFILVLGGLILSCALKDRPDIRISYNGPANLTKSDLDKIDAYFSKLVPDYDKDGKTDISWSKNRYLTEEQIKDYNDGEGGDSFSQVANSEALTQINHVITFSDFNFLLLDTAVFDEFADGFFTISELGLAGYNDITYRDCGIYLHKTTFANENPELKKIFPADTVICIPNRNSKNIDKEVALLKAILEYQKAENEQ